MINDFLLYSKIKKIKKMVTLKGEEFKICRSSYINLYDGSTKEDIILGDRVKMYGGLASQSKGKIIIGDNVRIGSGTIIGSVNKIIIGDDVLMSSNITIMDNNNHSVNPKDRAFMQRQPEGSQYTSWKYSDSKPIFIERNVWIGVNSRINKGVKIGENSIIAANSVVTKDVPPNCIAAGNPARIVKVEIDKAPRLIKQ